MRAKARWVTDREKAADHEHNGVVEGTSYGQYNEKFSFYVSPMALAERVSAALNVTAKFSNEELKRLSDAVTN